MKAAKRLYRPHAFITVPENCLDPTRDHFSFNYVFHVCVPKLHPQWAASKPSLSHTSSSPTLSPVACQNRIAKGLSGTCVHPCSAASVQCMCDQGIENVFLKTYS